jgi:hypothetical protein
VVGIERLRAAPHAQANERPLVLIALGVVVPLAVFLILLANGVAHFE